jgi:hypothetical protein
VRDKGIAFTAEQARGNEKIELIKTATDEHQLSWVVSKFSSRDRWPLADYETKLEQGSLVVVDRDTDVAVYVYAAAGVDWHNVWLQCQTATGEWIDYKPAEAHKAWKAAQ